MDGAGELDLPGREVAIRVVAELLSEDQDRVQRRAQLVAHIGEEFGLVFRGQRKLGGLLFQRAAGLLDLLVLAFHLDVALGELLCLLLELVVGLLQFALLGLQFACELLRLFEQAFGLHRRFDRIENDADGVGELLQEGHLRGREGDQRGELDHGLDLAFEQHREHHEVLRRDAEQRRVDRHHVGRNVGDHAWPFVERALADQAFAELQHGLIGIDAVAGVRGEQPELRIVLVLDLVDHAGMGVHQRRQFGEQQPADGGEVALALEHVGEFREVCLQPVLLGVQLGREPQVGNHRVDVVFQLRDLAAGVDLDRPRQVALGHGSRDFRDRAHL